MFEITLGGTWFRWSALDHRSRWLAGLSFGTSSIAAIVCALSMKPESKYLGADIGPLKPGLALLGIALAVTSAALWWRFSKRQDEMFNRIQNWSLGMAGAWTCAASAIWLVLERVFHLPSLAAPVVIASFAVITGAFWLVAVRKWVS